MTNCSKRWWLRNAVLALVLASLTAVLLFLGSRMAIGFDSYMHVFIARQNAWPNFWQEVFDNAHPPLFYLLLRVASAWLGSNLLAYRAISIAATVAGAWLLGAVVRRATLNRGLAVVAAAAYGFSYSALTMGLEVRSYALCAAFTLAACAFYLDWLKTPGHRVSASTYVGFALATMAAVVSHYSTLFFIAATLATPVILAAVDRGWRRRLVAKVSSRPAATAAMFGVPIAAAAIAYYVHVGWWGAGRLNHVPGFLWDPAAETAMAFLLRSAAYLPGLVVPGYEPPFSASTQWISLGVLGAVCLAGLLRLGRSGTPRLAVVPVVLLAVMLVLNAAAALAWRYPFGGPPRHEFFLFAFAVASFFSLVEAARRGLRRRFGGVWVAAAALGVVASVAFWTSQFQVLTEPLFQGPMTRFRQVVVSPQTVLLDEFSFISFFMHHHDWRWDLRGEWKRQPIRQVWVLTRGGTQLTICRDNVQWAMDMSKMDTYASAAECLQKSGVSRVALLRIDWGMGQRTWDESQATQFAKTLSDQVDLAPTLFEAAGGNVYAEFRPLDLQERNACSGPPGPPGDLHVTSNSGRVVAVSWTGSGPRTSYVVEAGRAPGTADVSTTNVGRATTFTASGVAPSTYYARVRGKTACGTGPASNELVVVVQ